MKWATEALEHVRRSEWNEARLNDARLNDARCRRLGKAG